MWRVVVGALGISCDSEGGGRQQEQGQACLSFCARLLQNGALAGAGGVVGRCRGWGSSARGMITQREMSRQYGSVHQKEKLSTIKANDIQYFQI